VSNIWSKPVLAAGVAAAPAVLVLGLLYPDPLLVAVVAACGFITLTFLFANRPVRNGVVTPQPAADARPALPETARLLLETLDDPVIVCDAGGRVLLANRTSRTLVGTDAERKHISAVLRYPAVLEGAERVLAGGEAESIAFTIPVPLERYYQVHIASAKTGHDGQGFVLMQFRDLTSIRRSEEMRADFVANASHELRTPLAAVSGFIDTLRGHARNDTDARERFLEIMSVETVRMRRLIDDLLSLTRIELNEHNPPVGEVDLAAVARDAAAVLSPLAEADDIAIEIEDSQPLWAAGEHDEITQVLQNLIHNAIKYGREKGRVRVRFGRIPGGGKSSPPQVFASVQDEGEGIPREAIPRLTERFYRVDIKRSRERGGTGLGLAIVKHILNRHNGRLQIDSVPGEGSTFTIYLPAADEAEGRADRLGFPMERLGIRAAS
jgi:two-component system phosphate regulon sensor histidine kinase PhoR